MTIDELTGAGIERMTDGEIRQFLTTQGFGVLGLAAGSVPYLLPMSFGYDEDHLYFTYVLDGESRKRALTTETEQAAFLVYDAPSAFQWQSVTLTGSIRRLPADQWDDFAGVMRNAWRPEIFKEAADDVQVYQLAIEDQRGYKHTGLPPGLEGPD